MPQHFGLGFGGRVAHLQAHQEAVELRLRQHVGPFEVHGVLRRDHYEGPRYRVHGRVCGHRKVLHDLEQRRLGLRGGPVDLVGEDHVGEHRAGAKSER